MIEKISVKQFAILAFINLIGTSIIFIPTVAANYGKQNAWIIVLAATFVGIFVVLTYTLLFLKNKGLNIFSLIEKLLGKKIGLLIILVFMSYVFLNISANLWTVTQFISVQILVGTPSTVVIFMIISTAVIAVRSGIEVLTRTAEVFFPFIVLSLILLCVMVLPEVRIENILPILKTSKLNLFLGGISILSFTFLELVILLGIMDDVNEKEKLNKYFLIGSIPASLIITFITLLCILVLGVEPTSDYTYPIYVLGQKINIASFIQRIEGIAAFIWFFTNFFKICTSLYVLMKGIKHITKTKDDKIWTIPIAYLIFSCAYNGYNSTFYDFDHTTYVPLTIIVGFIIPLLLFIVSFIRKNSNIFNKT